jgi:hypothetical protein
MESFRSFQFFGNSSSRGGWRRKCGRLEAHDLVVSGVPAAERISVGEGVDRGFGEDVVVVASH